MFSFLRNTFHSDTVVLRLVLALTIECFNKFKTELISYLNGKKQGSKGSCFIWLFYIIVHPNSLNIASVLEPQAGENREAQPLGKGW